MPIYEYICLKCSVKFSVLQSMRSSGANTKCPACSSGNVKKTLSAFSCSHGPAGRVPSASSGGFRGG